MWKWGLTHYCGIIFILYIVCNFPCGNGYIANATCDGCNISNICVADNPCQNNGTCESNGSPEEYTCTCNGNYIGDMCQSMNVLIHYALYTS